MRCCTLRERGTRSVLALSYLYLVAFCRLSKNLVMSLDFSNRLRSLVSRETRICRRRFLFLSLL